MTAAGEPYRPFEAGPFAVAVQTVEAHDDSRDQSFPCEMWHPASDAAGPCPLIVYSHSSGGHRRAATFLTTHLASHGHIVAALDHSELVSEGLRRQDGETTEERAGRVQGWIDNRVPDVRFLLDVVLGGAVGGAVPDPDRVGIVGHSFGGWTALAAADADERISAVVALAPAGSSNPRPGTIPVRAAFRPERAVPTLLITGDRDQSTPLDGVRELLEASPWPSRLVVLHDADHLHFIDDIAAEHEAFRQTPAEGDLTWIAAMLPIAELCPPAAAQAVVKAFTLAHLDATLRGDEAASALLEGDLQGLLAEHDIDAVVHREDQLDPQKTQ